MTPAARSMNVFGIYLLVLGGTLLVVPNLLLAMFGIAATAEVWIRVLGLVAGILGAYYVVAAVRELKGLFIPSVLGRVVAFVVLTALVIFAAAPAQLVLFGLVDLLAAMWTWRAMRVEART